MAKAKIGDIEITIVSSEVLNHGAETTDHAVEDGKDVSDHTKTNAPTIDIVGMVAGDDASSKLQKLKKYQREGKLLNFTSRNSYNNMFILSIETNHAAKIRNGFEFDITLKQIRIAKAKEVEINVVNPVTKVADKKTTTKVKAKVSAGKQQPKKKAVRKKTVAPSGTARKTASEAKKPASEQIKDMGIYQGGMSEQATSLVNLTKIRNQYIEPKNRKLGIYQGGIF